MPARLRGDTYVLEHRGVRQDVGNLIGAGNALLRNRIGGQAGDLLAIEDDAAAARPQHSSQAIKEGAFAGAVRSDDGANLAAAGLEIDLRERGEAAELNRQGFGLEDCAGNCSP